MFNNISTTFNQSICFSGSGHHYPWQVGVAMYLQENYDLSNISFLGTSAGSFVALLIVMNVSMTDFLHIWVKEAYQLFNACWTGCYMIYHSVMDYLLHKHLAVDDFKKANGRLYVSVTEVDSRGIRNNIISEFYSNDDLFHSIGSSTHIPYLSSPSFFYPSFRGGFKLDGAFTYNWLRLNNNTIMISPYQWSSHRKYTYALSAFFAPTEEQFHKLVMRGYRDALVNDDYFMKGALSKKL
jgi:hypothetical protein